ncbi:MAG: hypothetical protein WD768_06950 [Phycisphaeraceae bacterium]
MARQTCAARTDHAEDETWMLMERVVQRDNMLAAQRAAAQHGSAEPAR